MRRRSNFLIDLFIPSANRIIHKSTNTLENPQTKLHPVLAEMQPAMTGGTRGDRIVGGIGATLCERSQMMCLEVRLPVVSLKRCFLLASFAVIARIIQYPGTHIRTSTVSFDHLFRRRNLA